MTVPSGTANFPLGFESVTINSIAYKVDAVDIASETTRIINRPDENGDAADFQIRKAGEKITGTITLQRATTTTALPDSGDTFTYDYDRSNPNTDPTLTVTDVKVSRSKDAADVFEIGVLVN
tara:strand:+ start:8611 stop:8976 length:366 start_codon:yes stop_codon:yes gene_type:complete